MKKLNAFLIAFGLVTVVAGAYAFSLPAGGGHKVKVKIVKIVDGDTTITEKIVDESELANINKDMEAVKGKNVKVMMYVNSLDEEKEEKESMSSSHTFSFDFDSLARICRIELNIDSLVKAMSSGFDFTVITDDGKDGKHKEKKVIMKKSGSHNYSFNTDSVDTDVKIENDGDGKSTTIIITSPDEEEGKKVIVKSSVIVTDDNKPAGKKKPHDRNDPGKDELKFYPNPSDGKFNIECDLGSRETAVITVTDANGKELFKDEIKGGGHYSRQVNLGEKGKGIFILNLQQGKKSISRKIIIE